MAKEGEREDCPAADLIDTTGLAARIALAAAQSVLQIDDSGVCGGSRNERLAFVPSAEMDRRALAVHGLFRSPDPLGNDPVDVEHSHPDGHSPRWPGVCRRTRRTAVWRLAVDLELHLVELELRRGRRRAFEASAAGRFRSRPATREFWRYRFGVGLGLMVGLVTFARSSSTSTSVRRT
jgi:hypothetical protein